MCRFAVKTMPQCGITCGYKMLGVNKAWFRLINRVLRQLDHCIKPQPHMLYNHFVDSIIISSVRFSFYCPTHIFIISNVVLIVLL